MGFRGDTKAARGMPLSLAARVRRRYTRAYTFTDMDVRTVDGYMSVGCLLCRVPSKSLLPPPGRQDRAQRASAGPGKWQSWPSQRFVLLPGFVAGKLAAGPAVYLKLAMMLLTGRAADALAK